MKRNVEAHVVDVVHQKIFDAKIVICNGRIEQIAPLDRALPKEAPYALPGFIDSHIHIESTLLSPDNFARLAVSQGTVAVVADPHEIANVMGIAGVDYMINSGNRVRFHFNFGAPSGVPATTFETSGAVLDADKVGNLLKRDDIYGLAEVMNVPGVLFGDPDMMAKLSAARLVNKPIDGHAPSVRGKQIEQYVAQGITTDHECTTIEEAEEKLKLGMKILIREGSAACDFETLAPLLAKYPNSLMFCTDDKYADELKNGHINEIVKRSVSKGLPLWNILNAACLTPHRHYGLTHGLLQEGDSADFVLVDNLVGFNIISTTICGYEVFNAACGTLSDIYVNNPIPYIEPINNFKADRVSADHLRVAAPIGNSRLKVIVAKEGSLFTDFELVSPKVDGGEVVPSVEDDVLKLVVVNRYNPSKPQVAFIRGFGLKQGAIASTIAHDSHNIISLGCSDQAIANAINALVESKGGLCVCDEIETTILPLPIAGLMSDMSYGEVAEKHICLKAQSAKQGCVMTAPFMTLAFMALPVIPKLKITDLGLFDGISFSFTDLFES